MARLTREMREGRPLESIHIGGVVASEEPCVIRTILGSCISVCLRDPVTNIGGMNHFMLPKNTNASTNPTSYGVHAMEVLINRCMSLGADRSRLEAKVFGGGHVLNIETSSVTVARQNIDFSKNFLRTEKIPVISHDVGGFAAREVIFFTDSGKVLLRRLAETGLNPELTAALHAKPLPVPSASDEDVNVTLF